MDEQNRSGLCGDEHELHREIAEHEKRIIDDSERVEDDRARLRDDEERVEEDARVLRDLKAEEERWHHFCPPVIPIPPTRPVHPPRPYGGRC